MSNIIMLIGFATGTGNANSKYLIKIFIADQNDEIEEYNFFVYQIHINATLACYLKKNKNLFHKNMKLRKENQYH